VHRSWCAENPGWRSNERLEFLGDSVLGIVITDHLFTTYPELAEGDLAKVRASVVSAAALSEVADELALGDAMLLGKGEDGSGGREKPSILADALEAVLGVVYVEVGMDSARDLVLRLLLARTTEAATGPGGQDYKTRLQEIAARLFADQPAYEVTDQGPDHAKHFFAEVRVDGAVRGRGQGRSKKQAEQAAARDAWQRLRDGGDPLPATAVPADPTMEAAAGA
jgi:ribonuclease III